MRYDIFHKVISNTFNIFTTIYCLYWVSWIPKKEANPFDSSESFNILHKSALIFFFSLSFSWHSLSFLSPQVICFVHLAIIICRSMRYFWQSSCHQHRFYMWEFIMLNIMAFGNCSLSIFFFFLFFSLFSNDAIVF